MKSRIVRVVCSDGSSASVRLLDLAGEPISEIVKRATITIEAGELARGTFLFYKPAQSGRDDEFDSFEADVVLGA